MKILYWILICIAIFIQFTVYSFGSMFTAEMAVLQLNDSNVDYALGSKAMILPMVLHYGSLVLLAFSAIKLITHKSKEEKKNETD